MDQFTSIQLLQDSVERLMDANGLELSNLPPNKNISTGEKGLKDYKSSGKPIKKTGGKFKIKSANADGFEGL